MFLLAIRRAAVIALLLVTTACSPRGKAPLPSPDGAYTLVTSVERGKRDMTTYGCVIVEVRDREGRMVLRVNSQASAYQRWSVVWQGNDTFRLNSSDIGARVWQRQPDGTWRQR